MAAWQEINDRDINELLLPKPPLDCKEVSLKLPFGKGRYKLKYKEIKRSATTTLVTAYTRPVRVKSSGGIYWRSLPVEPYKRRIPTYYIERQEKQNQDS